MEQKRETKRIAFGRTTLQMIAMITMVCDHFACLFLQPENSLFSFGEEINTVIYTGFRTVGRLSFPIFVFLLVQGFQLTKNLNKYILRLFLFAVLSEIPYDLAFSGVFVDWNEQNVIFTLLLGLIVLTWVRRFEMNWMVEGVIILAGCILALFLQSDYNYFGVLLLVVTYFFRGNQLQQMFWMGVLIFSQGGMESFAALALPICYFYQWDKEEKPLPRYFFYAFYPLHLLIFGIIHSFM